MAEEIGALRAVLALESAAFDKGVASARRQLGAMDGSLQKTGGQVVQFGQRVSRDGARAFNDLNRSAGASRAGLQNVGFQVQDLAVQIAGGTDASRALAQQLPQLLSGFGLFGVLAGTASAILIPFAASLFSTGEEAKKLDAVLSSMDASVKALQQTTEVYTLQGLVQQIEKYGELNAAVLLLIERQRQLAADTAIRQAADAVAALNAQFGDGLFATRSSDVADFLGIQQQTAQLNEFGDRVIALNPAIAEFDAALQAVSSATTFADQASAISNLLTLLDGTAAKGGEVYGQLVQAESATRQLAAAGGGVNGWLDAAVAGAGSLVSRLYEAASAALTVGTNQSAPMGVDPATFKLAGAYQLYGDTRAAAPAVPAVKKVTTGGGGTSEAQKEANDLQREAARVFAQTRTEAEKYGIELGKLNTLLAAGEISQDTFNRAVDELKDKAGEASSAAQSMESAFSSAFTSFVTGAESARDAVSNLLASLADTLANEAFSALSKGLFGDGGIGGALAGAFGLNANGNAFSGGRVTAFAAGGVVNSPTVFPMANGAGLMGEAGPEAIMPLTRIGGKLGVRSSGGGATVVNIDARGAVEGTDALIARRIQQAMPEITRRAVSATGAARARGY